MLEASKEGNVPVAMMRRASSPCPPPPFSAVVFIISLALNAFIKGNFPIIAKGVGSDVGRRE